MFLKRQNKGSVLVHALLLDEMLVLLQREGEKYFLKCFQMGQPSKPLSPIIKTNTLLFRENAICKYHNKTLQQKLFSMRSNCLNFNLT